MNTPVPPGCKRPIPWADLHEDLLHGIPSGWVDGQPQPLDPGRLVKHLRKLPIRQVDSATWLLPNGKRVHRPGAQLLYMALAERGWTISRKAAKDALALVLQFEPPR